MSPKSPALVIDPEWEAHVWKLLETHYGIPIQAEYRLLRSGRRRVRMVSQRVYNLLPALSFTATPGLYIAEYSPTAIRLSMDGAQILGPFATKQIIELDDDAAQTWLQGKPSNYKAEYRGYVIVINNGDILGCGSISNGLLHSFVPKARRPTQSRS